MSDGVTALYIFAYLSRGTDQQREETHESRFGENSEFSLEYPELKALVGK